MVNKRKQRVVSPPRRPLLYELRTALLAHVRRHVVAYLPAMFPVVFFFLAHLLGLATALLEWAGVAPQECLFHKEIVTWAVYGFLPLLFCSYGCFFITTRLLLPPLAARCASWPDQATQGTAAGVHAALVAGSLLWLLGLHLRDVAGLLTLLLGLVAGLGNWFLHRTLVLAPRERLKAAQAPEDPSSDDALS